MGILFKTKTLSTSPSTSSPIGFGISTPYVLSSNASDLVTTLTSLGLPPITDSNLKLTESIEIKRYSTSRQFISKLIIQILNEN